MYQQIFFLSHSMEMFEQDRKRRYYTSYYTTIYDKRSYWTIFRNKFGSVLILIGNLIKKDVIVHSQTAC